MLPGATARSCAIGHDCLAAIAASRLSGCLAGLFLAVVSGAALADVRGPGRVIDGDTIVVEGESVRLVGNRRA